MFHIHPYFDTEIDFVCVYILVSLLYWLDVFNFVHFWVIRLDGDRKTAVNGEILFHLVFIFSSIPYWSLLSGRFLLSCVIQQISSGSLSSSSSSEVISSRLFIFVVLLCDLPRHTRAKCPSFEHLLHFTVFAGQLCLGVQFCCPQRIQNRNRFFLMFSIVPGVVLFRFSGMVLVLFFCLLPVRVVL